MLSLRRATVGAALLLGLSGGLTFAHEGHAGEHHHHHDHGEAGVSSEAVALDAHGSVQHVHEEGHDHKEHAHEHHAVDAAHHHHHHHHEHEEHGHHHHAHAHEHEGHSHDHHDHEHGEGCSHHHHDHDHDHDHHHHDHDHDHHGHSHGAPRLLSGEPLQQTPLTAIALTTISGLAAAAGGLFVVLLGLPSPKLLGHLLSFAAGIMLYISYADLLPHAVMDLEAALPAEEAHGHDHHHHHHGHGHDHEGHSHGGPGFFWANAWMFIGMAFFAVIVSLVPEVEMPLPGGGSVAGHSHGAAPVKAAPAALEDAAPAPKEKAKRGRSKSASRGKPAAAAAVVAAPPMPAADKEAADKASHQRLWMTGIIAALGISLHNAPEGLIVYNQTINGVCMGAADALPAAGSWSAALFPWTGVADLTSCFSRGLAITFAIALHNVPEGMVVASPLYASTGSKWTAMKYCILSGLIEPAAAIVFGLLFSSSLTAYARAATNAAVAGIMICLCIIELIPAACEHISPKAAAVSNVAGQAVMFLSLHAMRAAGVH